MNTLDRKAIVLATLSIAGACAPSAADSAITPAALRTQSGTDCFRVMTFNIVHGTRFPLPSWVFPTDLVRARLHNIALQSMHQDVDAIGLQEADGDLRFNRTQDIATAAGMSGMVVADGEQSHGATLASRRPIEMLYVHRFSQRQSDPKGFVIGRMRLAAGDEVDIVSVHLDAFSASLRQRQADELLASVRAVQQRHGHRPLVVMGDFNEGYSGATQRIAEELSLTTLDRATPTYTDFGLQRRLDWVFVSPELEMVSHQVLDGDLSDHHPIVADIRVRRNGASHSASPAKTIR